MAKRTERESRKGDHRKRVGKKVKKGKQGSYVVTGALLVVTSAVLVVTKS